MTAGAAYLCVHLPEFPAQAMLRLRVELQGRAVAVVEGVPPLERVCSVNRRAGRMGVRWGMTRAELDSFDRLTVLRRAMEEERSAKAAVMEVAGAFTPRVEGYTAGSQAAGQYGTEVAYVVVLEVRGNERVLGAGERMAKRLIGTLRELGLVARVAVSASLLTSVVMARALDGETVRVVERGTEAAALAALPLGLFLKRLRLDLEAHPPGAGVVRMRSTAEAGGRSEALKQKEQQRHERQQEQEQRQIQGCSAWFRMRAGGGIGKASEVRGGVRMFEARGMMRMSDEGSVRTIARPAVITIGKATGNVATEAASGPCEATAGLGVMGDTGAEERDGGTNQSVVGERPAGLLHELRMRAAGADALAGVIADSSEVWSVGGADAGWEVSGIAGVKPVFAVGVRRMRPPAPIRWKGDEATAFWMEGVLYAVRERYGPWRRSGAWWTGEVWSEEEWDVTVEVGSGVRLLCLLAHSLLLDQWHMDGIYD